MGTKISGFALVISKPTAKFEWENRKGESVKTDRRKVDAAGHELSGAEVLTALPVVGVRAASLLAPDAQLAEVEPGALLTFSDAETVVRAGDFGALKVTVSVERLTAAGDGIAALEAAAARPAPGGSSSGKAA